MPKRLVFYGLVVLGLSFYVFWATSMPGSSHEGPLPAPTAEHHAVEARLRAHVQALAGSIGERNLDRPEKLLEARDYLQSQLQAIAAHGAGKVTLESLGIAGANAQNVVYELPGDASSIVVVGAHYDSAEGSPAANDNASGVAAALELARHFSEHSPKSTLRFVLFANEEPPYFKNAGMGSLTHARNAQQRGEPITAMLSLETLGMYSNVPGSQKYPWPIGLLYPDQGNFVAFVGNLGSRSLVRQSIAAFREHAQFPSEGAALPATFPGVDWSDHWSFWQAGYPALMVTDTALFRDASYHTHADTPEHLDYASMARVVLGLEAVVSELAK